MAEKTTGNKKSGNSKGPAANPAELKTQLERAQIKLIQTEMLLSVTQKIAGLRNLSEILRT